MNREGLKEYLQGEEDIKVVGESENGKEAFRWLQRHQADVVTDVSMPVMDGIELARVCKQNNANQKVLMLSTLNDDRTFKRMISTGVNRYILKTCLKEEFISSIKDVYSLGVTNVIMASMLEQSSKNFEIPLIN
jgi:DNA-binding NarL/FixJ family response regulator